MPRPRKRHHSSYGTVTALPSGRFRARYTGPDGERRTAPGTFATRTAAEDWLATMRADVTRGQWSAPEPGQVTFGRYTEDWLATATHLAPRTHAHYGQLSQVIGRGSDESAHGTPDPAPSPEKKRQWGAGCLRMQEKAALAGRCCRVWFGSCSLACGTANRGCAGCPWRLCRRPGGARCGRPGVGFRSRTSGRRGCLVGA